MSSAVQGHIQLPSKNLQMNGRNKGTSYSASPKHLSPKSNHQCGLSENKNYDFKLSPENPIRHPLILQPLHSIITKFYWFAFKTSFQCFRLHFIYLGPNHHHSHTRLFSHCLIRLPTRIFTSCQIIPLMKIFQWFPIVWGPYWGPPNPLWAEPLNPFSTILPRPSPLHLHWPSLSSLKMQPSFLLQSSQINSSLPDTDHLPPTPSDQVSPSQTVSLSQ